MSEHPAEARRRRCVEHARELSLYLMRFAWAHFVTLTAAKPISASRMVREFAGPFVRRLALRARAPVPYFYALEGHSSSPRQPHLHALLAGTEGLAVEEVRACWGEGFTSVSVYDTRRAAAHYVTKGLLLDQDCYDFSRRMPPLRRDNDLERARAYVRELERGGAVAP